MPIDIDEIRRRQRPIVLEDPNSPDKFRLSLWDADPKQDEILGNFDASAEPNRSAITDGVEALIDMQDRYLRMYLLANFFQTEEGQQWLRSHENSEEVDGVLYTLTELSSEDLLHFFEDRKFPRASDEVEAAFFKFVLKDQNAVTVLKKYLDQRINQLRAAKERAGKSDVLRQQISALLGGQK
ncbi:MAG: hypothetical protein WC843_05880 [Candidatus Gracilibacteria bacterium]|jgi:hypothetical protein